MTTWDSIYQQPTQAYHYYDLTQPHENLAEIIKFFKAKKVTSVLDLGCGVGRNLIPLVKQNFTVTGLDESTTGINKLKDYLHKHNLHAKVQVGQFQRLALADTSFDAVISIQTLNHGYEQDILQGFAELNRVLKTGGLIFLTLPGRIAHGKVRYCLIKTAKKIAEHTYLPTIGEEIGVPHYIFTKNLIKKYLKNYCLIKKIWRDEKDYYCILAEKIG